MINRLSATTCGKNLKNQHPEKASTEDSAFPCFELLTPQQNQRLLLFCDHARNAIPPSYGDLGLSRESLERHIAYDIGAEGVTRGIAALTGAGAALAGFSRLLIDPNRGEDDPTLVMRLSDGAIIPGNARIGRDEIGRRIETYWRPYRRACETLVDGVVAGGLVPALVGIHSFTPCFKGAKRPWEVGILWDKDPRLAAPLIEALRSENLVVGDNEPYDGALVGDSMYELSTRRGLPGLLVEIRQDLLASTDQCERWAALLARVLGPILGREETQRQQLFGSRADVRGAS